MINNLQQLKGKTKLEFCKIISNCYDEMTHKKVQTPEDISSRNAKGKSKI